MKMNKFRAWDSQELDYSYSDEYNEEGCTHNECLAKFLNFNYGCELEQFTGLHDKNGKEIYEGDRLSLNYGIPPTIAKFVVEWTDDYEVFEHDCCSYFACGWVMRSLGIETSSMLTTHYLQDIEIIGTIHDEVKK
jgi:uncharacterized phage protein (TIGR01671 family)